MKVLSYNALAICFLAACVWFVWAGHIGFGVASIILAGLTSHTVKDEEA